ncbi:protein RESTRICTED TEV MOVEMENT 2-like [Gossypium australe]|uniref:Protein RESTRICTED TEV MOVEMENT 2-like n=1 Tax=Gossypium australe TaxID=47621 RepID=A0A5B6WN74_9ROSI|nr:protein RESTRICTED TEV MOVEMENT 2-like [Gossypium australe]
MAGRSRTNVPATIYKDFQPLIQRKDEQGAYVLVINLPGFPKEQINVTYVDSTRTIKVEAERAVEKNTRSRFSEAFSVPENCITQKIQGSFRNGVLTITMPKRTITQPQPQPQPLPSPPMPTAQAQTAATSAFGTEKLRDQKVPSPPPKAVAEPKPQMATAVPQAQTAVASDSSIEKQRDQKVPSPPKAVTEPKPPMATGAPQSQSAAATPQKQAKGKKKVEALPPLKKQEETQKKVYPIGDNTTKQAEEKSTGGSGPTTSTTPGIVDKKGETETKDGLKDLVKEQKTKDSMSEASVPKASEKAGVEKKPQEGGGGLLEKAKERRGMDRIMKSVKRLTSDEDEDRQLLINIGVSVLVIVVLGAYITYSYRSSGKAKH